MSLVRIHYSCWHFLFVCYRWYILWWWYSVFTAHGYWITKPYFLFLIPDVCHQEELGCADVHCFSSCKHANMIVFALAQLEGQNRWQTADESWRSQDLGLPLGWSILTYFMDNHQSSISWIIKPNEALPLRSTILDNAVTAYPALLL